MKTFDEFKEYFNKEFARNRKGYNKKLAEASKIARIFRALTVCFTIMYVCVIVTLALLKQEAMIYVAVGGVVVFCVLLAFSYYDFYMKEEVKEKFENRDKEILLNAILEKNFKYQQRNYIPLADIKDSNLFSAFDKVDGEDLLVVNLKNENIEAELQVSDVELKRIENKTGYEVENTIFSGFFAHVKLNKPLGYEVEINLDRPNKKFDRFITESELFNGNFAVYYKPEKKCDKLFKAGLMLSLLNFELQIKTPLKIKITNKDIYIYGEKNLYTLDLAEKVMFDTVKGMWTEVTGLITIIQELIKSK